MARILRAKWAVGIDFGGTGIKLGLVDASGHLGPTAEMPTRSVPGPRAFASRIREAIDGLCKPLRVDPQTLAGVGIGVPGPVLPETGLVTSMINVPGWHNVPMKKILEEALRGTRVFIDNDANANALGEWFYGAGERTPNMIGLTLGTGVGGGIIANGVLYHGATGGAAEIGHMVVNPRGPACACGNHGCLEAMVGTAAILRGARRAIRKGDAILKAQCAEVGLTPSAVNRAARAGSKAAAAIWEEVGRWCGLGIGSLINLFNPERIVIGGGVSGAWGLFYPSARRTAQRIAIKSSFKGLKILRAHFGKQAGVIGASVLVWNDHRPQTKHSSKLGERTA